MKKLVLIDSHAVIHRAWHALPPLTSPDGAPVNAVYGFASILLKMFRELKPDYAIAAFDHPGPTFRHVAFDRYKATRPKTPEALSSQFGLVKQLLEAFGVPVIEREGYEADDIIGTISREAELRHPDLEVIIVTGDLDTLQLVNNHTKVFTMRKGLSDTVLYDEAAVRARYGLAPSQLADFKGLRGDPSDNIPGVRGIGEKTASSLLQAHGTIDGVYRALKKKQLRASPSVLEALSAHEADALFSKTLAVIDRASPVRFVLAASRVRKNADRERARVFFERLGFESLIRRLEGRAASLPSATRPPALKDAPAPSTPKDSHGIQKSAHTILLRDPVKKVFLVAVGSEGATELPEGLLSRAWFRGRKPVYAFDVKSLIRFGAPADPGLMRDLGILWWLTDPGRRSYEPDALIRKEFGSAPVSAAEAATRLFAIAPVIEERVRREGLDAVYETIEAPLIPILAAMEEKGIGFDSAPLSSIGERIRKELASLEVRIFDACGGPFNLRSPRELSGVLFEKLRLAPKGIRKTEKLGYLSTRESELVKLLAAHPVIREILRFRELAKLESTYVDALPKLVASDGRIHTTWNQTGTATGRLSSQSPNLQNLPIRSEEGREIRKSFVAAKGYLLVAFDYSQLELRVAADLSGDEKMIEAFRRGEDIHRLTAAEVNNIPLASVTSELRYRAKALNFGILYGMGSSAFAESAGISRGEAAAFIEEYFRDFSGIARFIAETKDRARTLGYTETAFGRRRFFPDFAASNPRLQSEAERQALNHPIQGTAADIAKKAMIETSSRACVRRGKDRVRLLLQIHDELIFEITQELAPSVIPEIRSAMEDVWKGKVPMKVEVKRGRNWGELE